MNTVAAIVGSLLVVLLINALAVIRAKNARRLAAARLRLAQIVTEIERKMLSGEFAMGEVCHDSLYRIILRSEMRLSAVPLRALFRLPTAREIEFVQSIERELSRKDSATKDVVNEFFSVRRREFHFSQPFTYCAFVGWVLCFTGGITVLLSALVLILRGLREWQHLSSRIRARQMSFSCRIGEWTVAISDDTHIPQAA